MSAMYGSAELFSVGKLRFRLVLTQRGVDQVLDFASCSRVEIFRFHGGECIKFTNELYSSLRQIDNYYAQNPYLRVK
jgi:hypothetical protein